MNFLSELCWIFFLFFCLFIICVKLYMLKLEFIKRVMQEWECKPFTDAWIIETLDNYGLTGINILLFKSELAIGSIYKPPIASNICIQIPVKKSTILLDPFLLTEPESFLHFVLAHEIGHIFLEKGFFKIFWPTGYDIRKEIDADTFAASVIDKRVAEESLKRLVYKYGFSNNRDLDIRIMAFSMPTLFRRYV